MSRIFNQGSYFCEKCNKEFDDKGICDKCGGEVKFISMHSNRYLTVWMKSRKGIKNEEPKKTGNNGDINISLDDNVKKLRELLEQFPEMENPNDFDNELEKRRNVYKEIKGEVEKLGNDMEHIWAEDAWNKVKIKT